MSANQPCSTDWWGGALRWSMMRQGLTRDRRMSEFDLGERRVQIIDTAGLEEATEGSIEQRMREQTFAAMVEADLVVFMIDARAGVLPADETFAAMVRQSGRPVLLVTNKAEGRAGEDGYYDSYSLGFGDPIAISAEHGEGIGELLSQMDEVLGKCQPLIARRR